MNHQEINQQNSTSTPGLHLRPTSVSKLSFAAAAVMTLCGPCSITWASGHLPGVSPLSYDSGTFLGHITDIHPAITPTSISHGIDVGDPITGQFWYYPDGYLEVEFQIDSYDWNFWSFPHPAGNLNQRTYDAASYSVQGMFDTDGYGAGTGPEVYGIFTNVQFSLQETIPVLYETTYGNLAFRTVNYRHGEDNWTFNASIGGLIVPEPASLSFLAIGGMFLSLRRNNPATSPRPSHA